ncbi:MAG TPA: threonine/serine dehydratase [Candidatus Bathyarchaeia archaeon]|nr:threonine/serine dehydratase [Candidatus Bathyarchaeia archaeon]
MADSQSTSSFGTTAVRQAKPPDLVALVEEASNRIYSIARQTPVARLPRDPRVPESTRGFAKMEQLQVTGSFKLRGAANKIFSLTAEQAFKGVVASSTGNHGLGVAAAARHRGVDAEIFLSSQVPEAKRKPIEAYGARIRVEGDNPLDAELAARAAAAQSGRTYISPYNDWQVVAGQGTIAVELLRQIEMLDAVFIATGGGGLISGIGGYLRARSPNAEVVGCWPENSRVLYECLRAGKITDYAESYTLSESTAGGVEPGSITFELARDVIQRSVLVPEAAILEAMRWAMRCDWTIEGAAAVALAGFFEEAARYEGKTVAVVFCGGNLSPEVRELLKQPARTEGIE